MPSEICVLCFTGIIWYNNSYTNSICCVLLCWKYGFKLSCNELNIKSNNCHNKTRSVLAIHIYITEFHSSLIVTVCSEKYEFCIPQKVWWSIRKSNATIAVLVLSQLFYYCVFEKMSSVLHRNCFKKMILKHLIYCKNVIPILLWKHKGVYDA